MPKEKNMNLFGWLNEITLTKSHPDTFSEEDWKQFNAFMIHKYVSMSPDYIELVNYIQKIPYENKKQIYSIYREMIPKRKVFLKYIGSKKKKPNVELAEYVAKYFNCSLGEADEYIDILRPYGVTGILYKMGIEDKEIKKLLKS
jgi:hypothetical protein